MEGEVRRRGRGGEGRGGERWGRWRTVLTDGDAGVKIRTERMAQRKGRGWEEERIGANMARKARAGAGQGR